MIESKDPQQIYLEKKKRYLLIKGALEPFADMINRLDITQAQLKDASQQLKPLKVDPVVQDASKKIRDASIKRLKELETEVKGEETHEGNVLGLYLEMKDLKEKFGFDK